MSKSGGGCATRVAPTLAKPWIQQCEILLVLMKILRPQRMMIHNLSAVFTFTFFSIQIPGTYVSFYHDIGPKKVLNLKSSSLKI